MPKKKTTPEDKKTSKWILGGDGITTVRIPAENKERVRKMNMEVRPGKKKK